MFPSEREPCYSTGYQADPEGFARAVRKIVDYASEHESDADLHAEDVWHARYDGTEDVDRDG